MVESASDPEVEENPDVWELFRHYDKLYFRGALEAAGFAVEWTSPRLKTSSGFGSCSSGKRSKTITLYQPMLQHRTKADLKNALLHLMIHAIIFVKHGIRLSNLSWHGPVFRDWMDAINACSIEDYLRPKGGYSITTTHDFSLEELQSIQGNLWKCESCHITLVRATRLGPPSDSCCIENVSKHATCGNMLCNWHNHKINCGGTYVVPGKRGQKMVPKGYAVGCRQGLLTETSEMSKSQEAAQESDSDEVQENRTVAKPDAECKLLSQVGGSNARSPGSSFSKKASKSKMMPEDFQKAIVLLPENTSRKARTWQKPEGVALPPPLKKLKLDIDSADKQGDTKPVGSSGRNKERKLHKREGIQNASVVPAAPPRKLKQDLVASQKNELAYFVRRSNSNALDKISSAKAHKQREPEETRKPIAQPAVLQSVLKQQNKTNSSSKAEKPAVSQSILRQSNRVAPERQKRTRNTALERGKRKRKEYACYSVWAGIYESECSSGSAEPLVNKRTERRKRERERAAAIAYSRSRKARPEEEEVSSEQVKPPPQSQCLQFNAPRDQSNLQAPRCKGIVVPARTPGGRSQPPAAYAIATATDSANPPSLTPSKPSSSPEVVDISDDD